PPNRGLWGGIPLGFECDRFEHLWVKLSSSNGSGTRDPPTKEGLRTGSGWIRWNYPLASSTCSTHLQPRPAGHKKSEAEASLLEMD
ncbi:MAG: hypothetical protein ACKVJX_24050, partial [Verrucomicrobiia bacterium]